MNVVNFMMISRLAIHLKNEEINETYVKKLKRRFDDIVYDEYHIAIPRIKGSFVQSSLRL